jgi:signal transduction histidine kinase
MVPLSKWFRRKAVVPALGGIGVILLIQIAFYAILITTKSKQSESSLHRLSTIVQLGVLQKNRPLLESALDLGVSDLGAGQIVLCADNEVLVASPRMVLTCPSGDGKRAFIEVPLAGMPGHRIVYERPRFFDEAWVLAVLVVNLTLIGLLVLLLARLNKNIHTDILDPLRVGLISSSYFAIHELEEIRKNNVELQLSREREEIGKALVIQSTQVAHDIRSPLAALDMALKSLPQLPEETRMLIRGSIARIRDIANELLSKNRIPSQSGASVSLDRSRSVLLASGLIDGLISEKRMQFRSRLQIQIDSVLDVSSYGIFVEVHATEFKRVISNLINNAVESLGEKGRVTISLGRHDGQATVSIQDTGKGIPPDILPKLGQRGETHGKMEGSGLGLYHAKTTIELFGGSLEVASTVGVGTTVSIKLPLSRAPGWFVEKIEVVPQSKIVILDDDSSIHLIWDGRFESAAARSSGVEILHFSTPELLRVWVKSQTQEVLAGALFLLDYELIGFSETGLDLIEELSISDRSTLVTSRFEEQSIRARCERLGVNLIPKSMAAHVPIVMTAPRTLLDAVLIDDDDLVHVLWRMSADQNGKSIAMFKSPDLFMQKADQFQKSINIYIDVSLADGVRGDDIARELSLLGFKNLWLATGYDASAYVNLPFLKGVISKDPPF